jgi:superfamily II DNA/RNA helicase
MLVYISKLPKMTKELEADGPYALILAPTRELAIQIHEDVWDISIVCVMFVVVVAVVVVVVGGGCVRDR